MASRRIAVYYAWSRPDEIGAPHGVIENRFPAVFELRRMLYPRLQELADPSLIDQGVGGFLDHIMKKNFSAFVEQAGAQTGRPVLEMERVQDDGRRILLDDERLQGVDTLIVISFDSIRTAQKANDRELGAIRAFLAGPGRLLVVSPHHDIGGAELCRTWSVAGSRRRSSIITGTGLSLRSSASAVSPARSWRDSVCPWRIDLDCTPPRSPTVPPLR